MTVYRAPGTAGELVQGWIDGAAIHLSAPIDRFGWATFDPRGSFTVPENKPKTRAALERYFMAIGIEPFGTVSLHSELPIGKGMGSSTADIAAALAAVTDSLGQPLGAADIAVIALTVEPTDGSMFPGLALFDHVRGSQLESLGDPPPAAIVLIDDGGTIDTVSFNQRDHRSLLRNNEPLIREAITMARQAIRSGDLPLLGKAATLSARANQAILPKKILDDVIAASSALRAHGVCAAHSGTMLGVIVDPDRVDIVAAALRRSWPVQVTRLIGGGVQQMLAAPAAVLV